MSANWPFSTAGDYAVKTGAYTRSYDVITNMTDVKLVMGDNMERNVSQQGSYCNKTGINDTLCDDPSQRVIVTPLDIIMALFLTAFIICIIIGNILVVSAVVLFRDMRTLTNALIVSLAIADLLVAFIVLPISLHFEITDHVWTLGPVVCDFWITSDVFCCTASILNIVVIAMDRYWLITRNVRYTHSVRFPRKKVCFVMVTIAWSLSVIISTSPLLGWTSGHEKQQLGECVISQDLAYTVFSTFGAFWFPLSVIIITYFQIFKIAKNRAQSRAKSRSICPSIDESTYRNGSMKRASFDTRSSTISRRLLEKDDIPATATTPNDEIPNELHELNSSNYNGNGENTITSPSQILSPMSDNTVVDNNLPTDINNQQLNSVNMVATATQPQNIQPQPPINNNINTNTTETLPSNKSSSIRRSSYFSRKGRRRFQRLGHSRSSRMLYRNKMRSSARTLGLIIGCFVLCWMPFFIIATAIPFCSVCRTEIPPMVFSVTLWLGYSNSLLNPAIYAIWDKHFRRSFKKIVKCNVNWSHVF